MLSLRGNRRDSYSDSDDDAYSSFDESMQTLRPSDKSSQPDKPYQSTSNFRRQHDFLKKAGDDDANSSDDMEDTNIVSRLQRYIDSVDTSSYDLMSAVRSKDWKSALAAHEELMKNVQYIASQGSAAPYSFLSALKFSRDFFERPIGEQEENGTQDFMSELRQETPKELRKSLGDFYRSIKEQYESYAAKIERMDDDDADEEDSEESDAELEHFLNFGDAESAGSAFDESTVAAMLGEKEGFSLSALFTNQELSEENIMNKIQELRLKIAGGIAEKSTKENDKRLKLMKRSRNVYFSIALQSILTEVERLGLFPKSQVLLCALLFADCLGERKKECIQKHVYKDYPSLTETFPSMKLSMLCTLEQTEKSSQKSLKDAISLRQWVMAAEYFARYLSIMETSPDVCAMTIAHEESVRRGQANISTAPSANFGVDVNNSLLSPFTMASRLMEEYIEVVRATEVHETSYLGWLQAESVLLFLLEKTLLLYQKSCPRGDILSASGTHHQHTLLLASHVLFLLHYRTSAVHAQIYEKYYQSIHEALSSPFIKRNLTDSIQGIVRLFDTTQSVTTLASLSLRASFYQIHHLAVNGDVKGAVRIFHSARCDERMKEKANRRQTEPSEDSAKGEVENLTRVMYNRVLAVIATALFQKGKIQQAGQFLLALYLPASHQWISAQHGIYTKEILLAQLSLRHSTALRFSSLPTLQGAKQAEPATVYNALQAGFERSLPAAWKTEMEEVYLPPHLHLNSELLDCVFYVYCMLYQDSSARRGTHRAFNEPRLYKSFINGYERQNFLNEPKSNRDFIYAAIVAFRQVDWETCCARLSKIPLFRAVLCGDDSSTSDRLNDFQTTIKNECLKKFLLSARGVFSTVHIAHLSEKFALSEAEVRRNIVRMVTHRDVHGSFADGTEEVFVFDHSQHSALKRSVLQLSERVLSAVECVQKAQEYKHMQVLYNHPDSFGKGGFHFRNRHRGRGKIGGDGVVGIPAQNEEVRTGMDTNALSADAIRSQNEPRKIRGGTIKHAPVRNPFATLRGNRFVTR